MRNTLMLILWVVYVAITTKAFAQSPANASIYKIPDSLLAGEGLDKIDQSDSTRTVYQKKVYDGQDIAVYMVAIGTGITNEFENFPLEEFIFWMNGKAIIEPVGEDPFEIHTGDYFIQAKGFTGKWNFVENGGLHLELALVAKNRPDSTFRSPMTHALVIDRDLISGVTQPTGNRIYEGPELMVNLLTSTDQLNHSRQERMFHVLSGVLSVNDSDGVAQSYLPGDFFIVPENFEGAWSTKSLQDLRLFEVYKTRE